MFKVHEPETSFCETNWKLGGVLCSILVLAMLAYISYIYIFEKKSPLFEEIVNVTLNPKAALMPEQQRPDQPIAFQGSNLTPMEKLFSRSVVNIRGLPKDGSVPTHLDLGSGVLVHSHGYILTNYHIIKHANKFKATVFGQDMTPETFSAELIQTNPDYDLALLKLVSRKYFVPVYMGNLSQTFEGETVYALGNPHGVGLIFNQGSVINPSQILSVDQQPIDSVILVDGKIGWDNSGGPLVNSRGEAIGINVAIYSGNNFQQVNAAIPLPIAVEIFKDMFDPPIDMQSRNPAAHAKLPVKNDGFDLYRSMGLFLLGLFSGIMSGMLSMGGGIILVSGLIFFFHYGIILVRPIAYLANFFTSGASSYRYMQRGLLNFEKVAYLLPSAIVGLIVGYFIGKSLGMNFIQKMLAVFALATSFSLIFEVIRNDHSEKEPQSEADEEASLKKYYFLGLPMGFFSGVLGISGGIVEVPLQKAVLKTPMKKAIANSSGMVFFTSILGVFLSLGDGALTGSFDWHFPILVAMFVIPGAIIGGQFGAYLTLRTPMPIVKLVFATIMFIIALMMFFK